MELTERLHLVGSGLLGLSLTDAYDCNVYLVDGGDELALVDAGAGYRVERLLQTIVDAGYELSRIRKLLLTHKHADHSGGAGAIVREIGAEVIATAVTATAISDADAFNRGLERARRSGSYPADYVFDAVTVDRMVAGGDTVDVGDVHLRVVDTPGHCAGHCSFVGDVDDSVALFSGDAVLPFGQVVLQPIPDCSLTDSLSSVAALAALDADLLLAGHLAPVLRDARRHIGFAADRIARGALPEQLAIPGR